jgi:hypothetical protein
MGSETRIWRIFFKKLIILIFGLSGETKSAVRTTKYGLKSMHIRGACAMRGGIGAAPRGCTARARAAIYAVGPRSTHAGALSPAGLSQFISATAHHLVHGSARPPQDTAPAHLRYP